MTRGRCRATAAGRRAVSPNSASISSRTIRDDLLRRRQALEDFLIDRAIAHAIDERLDDLEVDVRLEQRHPDLAQRGFDGLLREAGLAPQRAETSCRRLLRESSMDDPARRPGRTPHEALTGFRRKRLS